MGRKPNFGFEKRQKDLRKKQKAETKAELKAEKRRLRTEQAASGVDVEMEEALAVRMQMLCDEGWEIWNQFAQDVGRKEFHPFAAADYEDVLAALLPHRAPGRRFLEWGSATGVITIMADLLGFEAYGIELDDALVATARTLATRFDSKATFAAGSFLPAGYKWRPANGDGRIGTIGEGESGYLQLGHPLEDFDVIFAYPWGGEEPMMLDLMCTFGNPDATLLMNTVNSGVLVYRGGALIPAT